MRDIALQRGRARGIYGPLNGRPNRNWTSQSRNETLIRTVMFYDPNSPNEQPVPLPSAPLIRVSAEIVVQPPLSRRGTGPGIVLYLPGHVNLSTKEIRPLDPEPLAKWAEEGYAVAAVTLSEKLDIGESLKQSVDALEGLDKVDTKDKFAVIGLAIDFVRPDS